MNKVVIYYGPKRGFDELLDKEPLDGELVKNLSALVREHDESSREHRLITSTDEGESRAPLSVESLVVHSDEYASVREHVILNFEGFLSNFVVNQLYLHNPPEILSEKIKKLYPNVVIKHFEYPRIDKDKIVEIYKEYGNNIIGQEKVRKQLLIAIYPLVRRNYKKPIVIMFYGPSGVGKTESAKYLSKVLGGDLLRKQLSMFQNNDFMTYLFGGHLYEKNFAKELLDRETNVILLDEFDKAHSVVHSAFYQFFDEGVFEDKNYSVTVGPSVIICTSNYNSLEEIKENLGDPIFSRFDACIKFAALSESDISRIVRLRIEQEYEDLEDDEKDKIDRDRVYSQFIGHLANMGNARRIESLVREVISNELLTSLLNKE